MLQEYIDRYTTVLQEYIQDGGEMALEQGYDLGRRAIAEGLGILDLVRVYQTALASTLRQARTREDSSRIATLASDLFTETLSPFEMTHRGFQEAVSVLSQRTIDLSQVKPGSMNSSKEPLAAPLHDFATSVYRAQEEERQRIARDLQDKGGESLRLVGLSSAMHEIRNLIEMAARTDAPVIVTGESGTGKEIVARLIHHVGKRTDKPFIALNCAALPKDVIENELFGHEKGAFTGASDRRPGCFELADQGVLFLDEIAEMNPDTQAKLLRAVELKTFRRLGGGKDEVKVDVRLIAATNKNIAEALKRGEFREDLYYRLSVIEIHIPPLRERQEDIPPLVEYFLSETQKKYETPEKRFDDEAIELLCAFDWPGNVRELRNVVERSVLLCQDSVIQPYHLPTRISHYQPVAYNVKIMLGCSAQDAERQLILQTLASVNNNKSQAAKILGISRKTLHNKLRDYDLS
jgi:DNA-binding NtrC family response regulator